MKITIPVHVEKDKASHHTASHLSRSHLAGYDGASRGEQQVDRRRSWLHPCDRSPTLARRLHWLYPPVPPSLHLEPPSTPFSFPPPPPPHTHTHTHTPLPQLLLSLPPHSSSSPVFFSYPPIPGVYTPRACFRSHRQQLRYHHTSTISGTSVSSSSGGGGGGRCLPPICPTLGGALPPAENSYVASFPRARSLSRPLSITSIYQSFARLSTFFVNITTI